MKVVYMVVCFSGVLLLSATTLWGISAVNKPGRTRLTARGFVVVLAGAVFFSVGGFMGAYGIATDERQREAMDLARQAVSAQRAVEERTGGLTGSTTDLEAASPAFARQLRTSEGRVELTRGPRTGAVYVRASVRNQVVNQLVRPREHR